MGKFKAKIAQDEEFSNQFKQIGQLVPVVVGKSESDIGVGMSSPELNEWMSASGYSAAEVLSWSVGPTTSRPREIGANRVGQILYRLNEKSINDARNSRQLRLEHDYGQQFYVAYLLADFTTNLTHFSVD